MANLIRVGMPINGRTRRFGRLGKGFVYSCPNCSALVSNSQVYCTCGESLAPVATVCSTEAEGKGGEYV